MTYFSREDHTAVLAFAMGSAHGSHNVERLHRRMSDIHRKLQARFKTHGISLSTCQNIPGGVSQHSAASPFDDEEVMTITYMRPHGDATTVERMMGREGVNLDAEIEPRRHPVIELRISPEYFAIELIIGPDAWHDQRNFSGKMTVAEHQQGFFRLLANMDPDYVVGFWSGIYPDDQMYLTTSQLPPLRIFNEFMSTFAAGRDYLRIGRWYEAGDDALDEDGIVNEVFSRVRDLYTLYDFALWSSNNNFQTFYQREVVERR